MKNLLDTSEKSSYFIVLFESWKQERDALKTIISKCKSAEEKKIVNTVFNFITSIYTNTPEEISLEVDQKGINYLEYIKNDFEAHIYNLSMYELYKLFDATGINLFKYNVRIGITNQIAGRQLKEEFKTYLKAGIVNAFPSEVYNDDIIKHFGVTHYQIENYQPETFWYKHNGVNIFIDSESNFILENKYVTLNPDKVSVINGAQTLTNIFLSMDELLEELQIFAEDEIDLKKVMEKILKNIFVKTIFIKGEKKLSKSITWGLNNQIPIQLEDFTAISKAAIELNEILTKYNMEILRTGELQNIRRGFSPLAFVKTYLIVKEHPGKSKNFKKTDLDSELKNALKDIQENENIIEKIGITFDIDEWWKNIENILKTKNLVTRFGKNYFKSYVVHILTNTERLDSYKYEDLDLYFEQFWSIIDRILNNKDSEYDSNSFKKDKLFEDIIKEYENLDSNVEKTHSTILFDENIKLELITFIENENGQEENYKFLIMEFNSKHKIPINYFRSVVVSDKVINHHFSLPNSTFEEFYKKEELYKKEEYPKFEDSLFLKELKKKYPLYVIYKNNKDGSISDIKLIKEFSLYDENGENKTAKEAFKKTKKAFLDGNSNLLPSVNNSEDFFTMVKASNKNDTFTFSDGKTIARRTFWAHKDFVFEKIKS
ncbi:hypothetical protein [Jeotgalibaca dankookensis]|uniref:hypothetical protein n=1 Tax=Jeotgalibaca dankookensis TaxID=708126 RepID=UPI000783DD2B|nr:hypothetical protein [Jeotgalibaca dankookensis]